MKLIACILCVPFLFIFSYIDKRIEYISHSSVKVTHEVKFDTVGGFVTYIDTTQQGGGFIMWMKGYEVTTYDMTGPVHVAFLDENFKPIKNKGLGLIK